MTLDDIAKELGLSAGSLAALGGKVQGENLRWAERNEHGEIIGHSTRFPDGTKKADAGCSRGLVYVHPLGSYAGSSILKPIIIVEGLTDSAAALDCGFDAIGRAMAMHGGAMLAQMLPDRHALIVGENDSGAGRKGAEKCERELRDSCASVRVVYPPEQYKDLRAWLIAEGPEAVAAGLRSRADEVQPTSRSRLNLRRMADIEAKPVEWLWTNRIPLGALSLIYGDPDGGKTTTTLDIAARISNGEPFPDGTPGMLGSVLILSAEDDPARTLRPRLDAAGANLNHIIEVGMTRDVSVPDDEGSERPFDLQRDLAQLELAIEEIGDVRLIILDPLNGYFGDGNTWKDSDVRRVLHPLSKLAERHCVAIVGIMHRNKNSGDNPSQYEITGSGAFPAVARAVWKIARDPADEARRVMLRAKCNLARADIGGLAFRIGSVGPGEGVARIEWEAGAVHSTADEWKRASREPTEGEEAEEWLRHRLNGAGATARDVMNDAKGEGFSQWTINKASRKLRVSKAKEGMGGGWWWCLEGGAHAEDSH